MIHGFSMHRYGYELAELDILKDGLGFARWVGLNEKKTYLRRPGEPDSRLSNDERRHIEDFA